MLINTFRGVSTERHTIGMEGQGFLRIDDVLLGIKLVVPPLGKTIS